MPQNHCGVDFGTTNSTVGLCLPGGAPRLIALEGEQVTIPTALFFSLERIVDRSDQESFVNHVRSSTRIIADQFENSILPLDDAGLLDRLDSLALSGEITLAELTVDGRTLRSRLSTAYATPGAEDFAFNRGADDTYLITVDVVNQQRTLKDSALWYREYIASRIKA